MNPLRQVNLGPSVIAFPPSPFPAALAVRTAALELDTAGILSLRPGPVELVPAKANTILCPLSLQITAEKLSGTAWGGTAPTIHVRWDGIATNLFTVAGNLTVLFNATPPNGNFQTSVIPVPSNYSAFDPTNGATVGKALVILNTSAGNPTPSAAGGRALITLTYLERSPGI